MKQDITKRDMERETKLKSLLCAAYVAGLKSPSYNSPYGMYTHNMWRFDQLINGSTDFKHWHYIIELELKQAGVDIVPDDNRD